MNVLPNNLTAIAKILTVRGPGSQGLTRASIEARAASALDDPIRWKCVMIFSEIGLPI